MPAVELSARCPYQVKRSVWQVIRVGASGTPKPTRSAKSASMRRPRDSCGFGAKPRRPALSVVARLCRKMPSSGRHATTRARPERPTASPERFTPPCRLLEAEREAAGHPQPYRYRLHDVRHFSATELIGAGVDPRTVASHFGHADPSVKLAVYAHALDERDREAAGLLGRRFGLPSSGRKEAMTRSSFDPLVKTPKQTVRVRFGTMTIGSRKRPFVPVLRACSRTRKMILGPL